MKKMINVVKNNKFVLLLGFFALLYAEVIVAMQAITHPSSHAERNITEKQGWYIYSEQDTKTKVFVDKNTLMLSGTIKNMLDDVDGANMSLPLKTSTATIQNAFDILKLYQPNKSEQLNNLNKKIATLTFDKAASLMAFFDYLQVPDQLSNLLLARTRALIARDSTIVTTQKSLLLDFDPDLQKLLMVEPIVNYLTHEIIKKHAQKRTMNLVGHPDGVGSVAFSPDGKKILSGGYDSQNNLLVWTLLTDQEDLVLKSIQNRTAEQIRLLYQLYSELPKGPIKQLDGDRLALYQTLPDEMQRLLNNILPPQEQGWFSRWW